MKKRKIGYGSHIKAMGARLDKSVIEEIKSLSRDKAKEKLLSMMKMDIEAIGINIGYPLQEVIKPKEYVIEQILLTLFTFSNL